MKPKRIEFSDPIEDVEQREKDAKEGKLKEEITPKQTQDILERLGLYGPMGLIMPMEED